MPSVAPVCECHGEPQRWNRDPRYGKGGFWKCRIKDRERARTDTHRAGHRDWWHRPDGGYVQRRRRQLAGQRTQILERLTQLEQEAVTHVEP